ncbi:MAG: hypothetical protein ACKO1O_00355 [Erythrobacter sp.]
MDMVGVLALGLAGATPILAAEPDQTVTEAEVRTLAAAYARRDLGSGRCEWVHPVTQGPTRIPCDAIPFPILSRMARNDLDKQAQLELGKRYEEGHPVPRDLQKARRWYLVARRDSPRGLPVNAPVAWSLGVGGHSVYAFGLGVSLPEAQERLRSLASTD